MSDAIKRLHYYDQEFLRSTDFTAEQNYHMSMRRLHNQVLHTWGIAQGLTLALAGMTLRVAPGIAVDSQGREMVINIATTLDLTTMPVNTTQYVTIAYAEQTSDHTTETGGEGDTRWTELPVISMAASLPADPSLSLLLGQITRAQDGSFSVNTTNRQKAATVLPEDLAANSLSLKSTGATPAQWPRLSSSGPNQAALNGSLTATGDVSGNNVVAAAYLKGAAANVAGIVNCDQVVQKNPAPDLQVKNSLTVGSPSASGSAGSIAASGDISGNNLTAAASLFADRLRTGPVTSLGGPGAISSSGANAEIDFARRNLTSWPATPVAGDRYAWINADGSHASLFTDGPGELLSVTKDGKVGIGTTTPTASLSVQNGCASIDGESSGVIVDAQGSKRCGLMKYSGIQAMLVGDSSLGKPVRLGRWSGGTIDAPTNKYEDVWLDSNGNLVAQNAVSAGSLSVSGNKASVSAAGDLNCNSVTATGNISGAAVNATGNISGNNITAGNSLTVGPISFGTNPGTITVTGQGAQLVFARRNCTTAPATLAAGDVYSWHNDTGVAQLWTPVNNQLLSVTSDGKLGIGTATPSQKLDVQGSINASGDISGNNITAAASLSGNRLCTGPVNSPGGTGSLFLSGVYAEVGFARQNLTAWPSSPAPGDRYYWNNPDGSRAALRTDVGRELFCVTKDGNLGIGTATPSQKLDVQGNINATGTVTCNNLVQKNPTPAMQILVGVAGADVNTWAYAPGTTDQYITTPVTFSKPFSGPPAVSISLSLLAAKNTNDVAIDMWTSNVTATGFNIVFKALSNSRIYYLKASWIAVL